jgi:hypothetical protein
MVLVRDGRAEERDDHARFLGIEILLELGRAFDVREQRGDGLALALEISEAGVSTTRIGE